MAAPAHANGHTAKPNLGGQQRQRAIADAHEAQAARESQLATLIGESVSLHLGPLLGELVQRVTAQPECFFCLVKVIGVVRAYEISVANAQQANEPVPGMPKPPEVARSVTRIPVIQMANGPAGPVPVACDVPACFGCMREQASAEGQRQPVRVGLVDVAGQPLSFRRG